MDRKTLNVLLIEDSPDYAGLVQHWLSGTTEEVAFVLNWTDTLAAGLDRLARGGVDVVLLDLGLPDSFGAKTFLSTRAHAPGVPVIILSAADSESLALQMIQDGAEDYLVKSTCTAELIVKALRYAVIRRKGQVSRANAVASDKARMIGVVGAKGGVGTTTVACNLAAALRRETGKEVLLADLDANSGLVSFFLNLDPQYSLPDAVGNLDRLDQSCWDTIVTHGPGGLHIIVSTQMLGDDVPAVEDLTKIFNLISPFYQWIVVDFGRLNGVSMRLLDLIDEMFVVTTTALPALHEAKRVIDTLVSGEMDRERLRLIVNQTENVLTLSGSELKQIFGIGVYATLPNDSQELYRACLERKLPAAGSDFGRQIVGLSHKLAGIKEKKGKRNLPEFLSFVERFHKGAGDAPEMRAARVIGGKANG